MEGARAWMDGGRREERGVALAVWIPPHKDPPVTPPPPRKDPPEELLQFDIHLLVGMLIIALTLVFALARINQADDAVSFPIQG